MYRLRSGKLTFYGKSGKWIGPSEMKEPTYHETLKVVNGIVETDHPLSVQWLINRGYILIGHQEENSKEEKEEDPEREQEEELPKVGVNDAKIDPVKRTWNFKNPPGRPRKN